MRNLPIAAALLLASCGPLDREAMVLPVERGWSVEIADAREDGAPDGLLWRDGRLWMADEGGSAVRVKGPGGWRTLAGAGSGLRSPEDLALGPDGSLYFSDDSRGGIWRIDPAGRTSAVAAPAALASTEALALSPGGDLIAGDPPRHRIVRIAADGRLSVVADGIAKPESFAFDGRGNLYIADNEEDVLYLRTPDGRLHRTLAGIDGFSPESLHFEGGNLFITDSRHGKLFRYSPEDGLDVVALFAGRLANVQGVTGDGRGNLWVSVQSDLKARKGYILRLYRKPARA